MPRFRVVIADFITDALRAERELLGDIADIHALNAHSEADLQRGLTVLTTSGADYAFSATSYPFPIQRAIRVDAQGQVSMFSPESFGVRSQDLEPAFHDAGQFYWGTSVAWRTNDLIFSPTSRAVLMPRRQVQDIDTLEDWEIAELLFTVQRPDA